MQDNIRRAAAISRSEMYETTLFNATWASGRQTTAGTSRALLLARLSLGNDRLSLGHDLLMRDRWTRVGDRAFDPADQPRIVRGGLFLGLELGNDRVELLAFRYGELLLAAPI
jgi:hypothetical protein